MRKRGYGRRQNFKLGGTKEKKIEVIVFACLFSMVAEGEKFRNHEIVTCFGIFFLLFQPLNHVDDGCFC